MSDGTGRLPTTDEEWQEAVDLAHGLLMIESARIYGLVEGGPDCDVERCEEILELGKRRGAEPTDNAVETMVRTVSGYG